MYNDISLTPFSISPQCTPENKQIIRKITKNLKINLFLDTKLVTQHTLKKHHLSHYRPAIFLTNDQLNRNYIFEFTDENNRTITHCNNHAEYTLEQVVQLFLHGHEMKQERNKVSAITKTTYRLIKDSTPYLKEVKKTANQSFMLVHGEKRWRLNTQFRGFSILLAT